MRYKRILPLLTLFILLGQIMSAQISPGDLSRAHASLEGVSNCTKCHEVGNKVTRKKCLDCHKEIKANIDAKKGYHASAEVAGKECSSCHNEHHGRNFQIIRLDKQKFNHALTGFPLKGEHAKLACNECHRAKFIKDPTLKKRASTYLGLSPECLSCHADYHQGQLSSKCTDCHGFDTFKKTTGFDHSKTRFPLLGQHKKVACIQCHKIEIINGKPTQKFRGVAFANCTDCHKDVHKNKFGQNCKLCHTEESFHYNKGMIAFNHDKTNFKLLGKHKQVDCKSCHKNSMIAPLKHDQCKDCHADYHNKDFEKNGISPDCNQCHTNDGFTPSTFTVEKHSLTKFPLEGAHLATPCMACHKKQEKWSFRNMGHNCVDCHKNVHKGFMEDKYIANNNCTGCHNTTSWKTITFDHSQTKFKLEGAHAKLQCIECHYKKNKAGVRIQQFAGLSTECSSCHKNPHVGQFEVNGKTDCTRCHTFENWKDTKFDHNTSRFKLEGAHAQAKCNDCHKKVIDEKGKYRQYKFKSIECSTCHS